MPSTHSDSLRRLRAANPAPVDIDLGRSVRARETLDRILANGPATEHRSPRRIRDRLPRGGLGIAVAVALAGGGAAVAATNPFGWWSANPDTAKYAVNPAAHVRSPAAPAIRCRTGATRVLACSAAGSGQPAGPGQLAGSGQLYTRVDTIHLPGPANLVTRANFLKQIARAVATHKLSSTQAAKFRADLAEVPDSFFAKLQVGLRYGTYGGGADNGRVPPTGVPEFMVCGQAGSTLTCQDLNGDEAAPTGAGVYMAQPAPDWRPAPPRRTDSSLPAGLRFTPAEYRVLVDMVTGGTVTSGSSSTGATRVSAGH